MGTLTIQSALADELPDGFDTTLLASDRLRQLNNVNVADILGDTVEDYDGNTLTERDIVRVETERVINGFQTPERALELPGTALNFSYLEAFAAYYKQDNDTPSGTVKDPARANTDDIVFTFANPEVYEQITGNGQDTFKAQGLNGGTVYDVIGDSGLAETGPTNGTSVSLDDNEMLFFTGDYIDISGGESVVSKIRWTDVDGEDYGANDAILYNRLSGTHVLTSQGAWVKSTADLDAKVYEDGNAEFVPVAFYMAPGTKAPGLV